MLSIIVGFAMCGSVVLMALALSAVMLSSRIEDGTDEENYLQ